MVTDDGEVFVIVYSMSKWATVMKTDASGEFVRADRFHIEKFNRNEYFHSLSDSEFVISGFCWSVGSYTHVEDVYIMKVRINGKENVDASSNYDVNTILIINVILIICFIIFLILIYKRRKNERKRYLK